MSGPKVIRIVTREEILMICRGHLARLDAVIEEWTRIGRRNETIGESDYQSVLKRRDEIRALLEQDRLLDLQKAVPDEIAFLIDDQQTRLVKAAAAKATAQSASRRTAMMAEAALARLNQAGVPVPDDLRRELDELISGKSRDTSTITRALSLVIREDQPGLTERQRRLAEALREGPDRQTIAGWIADQPADESDDHLISLEVRIAELAGLLGEVEVAVFRERLRVVTAANSARRRLLADSLQADLARVMRGAKERSTLQGRIRALAAELAEAQIPRVSNVADALLAQIDSPNEMLLALEKEAETARNRFYAETAARARRHAILSGLAALGYQVTEELETAWVQDGRVVLKKASQPGYGVEIGGGADAQRLQMRTVAFRREGAPADRARDADAETIWCSDLEKLGSNFAHLGGAIHIEVATPVGAVPVKAVGDAPSDGMDSYSQGPPVERRRTLG